MTSQLRQSDGAPVPTRVTFGFASGKHVTVSIGKHPTAQDRVMSSLYPRDRDTFMTTDLPGNASAASLEKHQQLIEQARKRFRPGRSSVLLTANSARLSASSTFGIHQPMFEALEDYMNVLYAPIRLTTAKKHCVALPQLAALRADQVVLGLGLDDFAVDLVTGKTLVDPDEFEYRLDWFMGELVARGQPRIIWCHNPPVTDGINEARNLRFSPLAAADFVDISEEICKRYGVTTLHVEPPSADSDEREMAAVSRSRLVERLVHTLREPA